MNPVPAGRKALSPTARRWGLLGFVAISVLTSVGHGGLVPENLGEFASDLVNPEEPGCAAETLTAKVSGNAQTGAADAPLGQALLLEFDCLSKRDRKSTFPYGSTLKWAVASGGGSVNGLADISQQVGSRQKFVHWHLGATLGTQMLVATIDGLAFSFTASALPPVVGGSCTQAVATTGTNFGNDRIVQGAERWTLAGSPYRGQWVRVRDGGALTIEAGVQVCLTLLETSTGVLKALGTAQAPVVFNEAQQTNASLMLNFFAGSSTAPPRSELKHVRGFGVRTLMAVDHAVLIEDSEFHAETTPQTAVTCSTIRLSQAISGLQANTVRRSSFAGYGDTAATCNAPAVWLNEGVPPAGPPSVFSARVTGARAEGVRVTAGNFIGNTSNATASTSWVLDQCDVTGSVGPGVLLKAQVGAISGCSITGNGGLGVDNQIPGAPTVLARGNWWGQVAGPLVGVANGVSPGVDAALPLAAPPSLGY